MSEPKIVIGAGAAGLTAAAVCAERGSRVLLIEKMERPGRKLRITGKGRCNVTNATFDLQGLLEHIPTNPRFLYSAFSNFMPYDTIALMEDLGVPTKIERGERVFPVSDNATDIVDALVRRAKNAGVQFAIVRAGYRGSVTGSLVEDPQFIANMKGATAAGIPVGVYFFTQATDEKEAVEEASAVISN